MKLVIVTMDLVKMILSSWGLMKDKLNKLNKSDQ